MANRAGRDLVELDATHRAVAIQAQRRDQVPGDGLAFAVRVGREQDRLGRARLVLQSLDDVLAVLGDDVLRAKLVFDVDAEFALWQIAHMPQAGTHHEVAAQEFFYRFGLGGRFDHHQALSCHVFPCLEAPLSRAAEVYPRPLCPGIQH